MPTGHCEIIVVGSINMDLVVQTDMAPAGGQTLTAREFHTIPGGKGANQAVAAARLGGTCRMVGRVGDDSFGKVLRAGLEEAGVDTRFVLSTTDTSSGVAVIVVEKGGENRILVVPGANGLVTPEDVKSSEEAFLSVSICLLQLELPLPTVAAAIQMCRKHNVKVVLDPAPATILPPDLWPVDVLTPNETEAIEILAPDEPRPPEGDHQKIAADLLRRGPQAVVLKLGGDGALFAVEERVESVNAFKVDVVDTTAAGDAFTAGLALGMAEGLDWPDSVRLANAAGALACTRIGAQPSLPTREAVERFLAEHGT